QARLGPFERDDIGGGRLAATLRPDAPAVPGPVDQLPARLAQRVERAVQLGEQIGEQRRALAMTEARVDEEQLALADAAAPPAAASGESLAADTNAQALRREGQLADDPCRVHAPSLR